MRSIEKMSFIIVLVVSEKILFIIFCIFEQIIDMIVILMNISGLNTN